MMETSTKYMNLDATPCKFSFLTQAQHIVTFLWKTKIL